MFCWQGCVGRHFHILWESYTDTTHVEVNLALPTTYLLSNNLTSRNLASKYPCNNMKGHMHEAIHSSFAHICKIVRTIEMLAHKGVTELSVGDISVLWVVFYNY